MTWTPVKPSKPGLYWYRNHRDADPDDYETQKVFWDNQTRAWSVRTQGYGTIFVDSYHGEWYGPITPPSDLSETWGSTKCNARISVRLKHGGSFYIEKRLPDEIAQLLSKKLRALRDNGDSIPIELRRKIAELVHELLGFAGAQR